MAVLLLERFDESVTLMQKLDEGLEGEVGVWGGGVVIIVTIVMVMLLGVFN